LEEDELEEDEPEPEGAEPEGTEEDAPTFTIAPPSALCAPTITPLLELTTSALSPNPPTLDTGLAPLPLLP
jgi:hypothetical protein